MKKSSFKTVAGFAGSTFIVFSLSFTGCFSARGKTTDLKSSAAKPGESVPSGSNVSSSPPASLAQESDKKSPRGEPAESELVGQIPAEVYHCNDGDTCRVKVAGGIWLNVRLAAIDAPEVAKVRGSKPGQTFGREAKDFLNSLIQGKKLALRQVDLDPFNRPVVEIFDGAKSINLTLIEEGYAEVYQGKTKRLDKSVYLAAEARAKKSKKGIWSQASYQSPKEFRQKSKS